MILKLEDLRNLKFNKLITKGEMGVSMLGG